MGIERERGHVVLHVPVCHAVHFVFGGISLQPVYFDRVVLCVENLHRVEARNPSDRFRWECKGIDGYSPACLCSYDRWPVWVRDAFGASLEWARTEWD